MVLNATSVVVGRRNRFFLCICGSIFDIIILIITISIVFVVVMSILLNR